MKCLPTTIVNPIAIALDDAKTFRQIRRLVVMQMYNVVIGMMGGDAVQPLYSVGSTSHDDGAARSGITTLQQEDGGEEGGGASLAAATEAWDKAEKEYWAAAIAKGKGTPKGKGGRGTPKGKGKGLVGYGECYNCGEWGHPACECPNPGKLHGGVPTAAAFKGDKGKGKFGKGKGKGNKGKGKNKYYNIKRSLNYASENDCNAALGNEPDNSDWPYYGDDSAHGSGGGYNYSLQDINYNYSGNYSMLLMRSKLGECNLSDYRTPHMVLHCLVVPIRVVFPRLQVYRISLAHVYQFARLLLN